MKLIERYVYDVTRRLPEKQREDVSRELLAEIHDMASAGVDGKRPTKKQIYAVLSEMGSPSSLADRYREKPRYLIGPDYYEPYISLLKTLLLVIIPILLVTVWMSEALSTNHSLFTIAIKLLGVGLETSLHIFFWTTASFWFVQKMADGQPHDYNWSPEDLPDLPPSQEITRGESFTGIAWSIFAIVALVVQVPIVHQVIGRSDIPQFFSAAMWPGWTLGLIAAAVVGLIVELWKLRVGGWTRSTVVAIAVVNIVTIALFWTLLHVVDPIVNPAITQLVTESLDRPNAAVSIALGVNIFVYIIIAICAWEIGEAVYKYKKGGKK
ncbi:MAG: hypothetical protein WAS27_00285 [Candidatus Saccharimonadales bacterium]